MDRKIRKKKGRGFTLIELLVVIAIIGILSTVVVMNTNSSKAKARDAVRKAILVQLKVALALYKDFNGSYPTTGGIWYSSETGDTVPNNTGNWVPGLVPNYVDILPKDPRGGDSLFTNVGCIEATVRVKSAFRYLSNSTDYVLLANCSPESGLSGSDEFYDSNRASYAWKVCSNNDIVNPGCGW